MANIQIGILNITVRPFIQDEKIKRTLSIHRVPFEKPFMGANFSEDNNCDFAYRDQDSSEDVNFLKEIISMIEEACERLDNPTFGTKPRQDQEVIYGAYKSLQAEPNNENGSGDHYKDAEC